MARGEREMLSPIFMVVYSGNGPVGFSCGDFRYLYCAFWREAYDKREI